MISTINRKNTHVGSLPIQFLGPIANGMKEPFGNCLDRSSENRSGSKDSGLGKYFGSFCTPITLNINSVPTAIFRSPLQMK